MGREICLRLKGGGRKLPREIRRKMRGGGIKVWLFYIISKMYFYIYKDKQAACLKKVIHVVKNIMTSIVGPLSVEKSCRSKVVDKNS